MVGVLSNKIQKDELKPGDHIYSWRHSYIYAHHASGIYVGNGTVIHFTRGPGQEIGTGTVLDRFIFSSSPSDPSKPPCPICGDQSKSDGVISSCLECFLYGGELYLFQYSVSPAMFLAKARGGTCTLAPSDPPEDVLHRAEYLLQNGFGAYNIFKNNCEDLAIYCKTAVGCGIYCISRIVSDIGVRRDVMKIPVERLVTHSRSDKSEAATETPNEDLSVQTGSDCYG
ncbi:uncharacterized protein LOC111401225 isoform X3 [Olea europaea var. sylvestris]|uniref:uncharacterized protein LOC111401225 isoform X3 n=1 Tax=Olea europaea var. sylvestris TaxID=158386 RepID=UPI000C1D02F2|nr:uncharacterized protein LOC111401225 isoform X3 [Olea europaea var. sylvestris]